MTVSLSPPPKKKTKTSGSEKSLAISHASSGFPADADITPFPTSNEWKESNCGTLLYFYPPGTPHSESIAGFDIDDTIIRTKSGKRFATNDLTDWKLWSGDDNVINRTIAKLSADGYRIVFFTNQEGITKGKVNKEDWKKKILNVIKVLNMTDKVTVLASLSKKGNDFRKPHIGMWRFLSQHLSSNDRNMQPDKTKSLYVGDAAGRPKRGVCKKDFSCSDYKFSLNVGIKSFMTPEQIFCKSKNPSDGASLSTSDMGFQPKEHWKQYLDWPLDMVHSKMEDFLASCLNKNKKEIIVLVGSPASSKSSIAYHLIKNQEEKSSDPSSSSKIIKYVRVNQDTLKSVTNCLKVAKEAISNGKSVVVDNTNRDVTTRKKYIDLAKANGLSCRCVFITTTKEESFHLNALRGAVGNPNGEDKRSVPDMVIHAYYKNMVNPSTDEGFNDIIEMPFVPGPFNSFERKKAFFRFTH